MESSDLRVFETVARSGSITHASEELHTVQSNVTARIKLLENEVGVPLFRRHSRGVALTPTGEQLLPYAVRIGQLLNDAIRIAEDRDRPRGTLRIGSLETTAALRVPPILAVFGRKFPEVQIVLMTGTTCGLIEEVLAYRLEAAFVAGPVCHPELEEKKAWTEELVLVTSPRFRTLDDALASSSQPNIIVFREGCTYRERLERLLGERGITAVRRLEMGTVDGILGCARAGLGITLMPRGVASRAASKGEIGIHSLPKNQAFVDTVCVRRKGAVTSAALDRFLESATTSATISKG
jgi:DNA-binding transcriptional LysR family regulator